MPSTRLSPLLRRALLADALFSGAAGLILLPGAGIVARLMELPEPLVRYTGLILLPYAALVAFVGTREHLNRPAVWMVIGANALWALDSIVLLLSGWVRPNALGYAFVVVQAAVVALFAEVQYAGLRRRDPGAAQTEA